MAHPDLESPTLHEQPLEPGLLLTNRLAEPERLLTLRAADGSGLVARLNSGHAERRLMVIGTPERVLGRYLESEARVGDVPGRRRVQPGAPRRQIVRQPMPDVEFRHVEVIDEGVVCR